MKRTMGRKLTIGMLALAGLATTLYADARDDLKSVKSDHDAWKSRSENAKGRVDTFISDSTVLFASWTRSSSTS